MKEFARLAKALDRFLKDEAEEARDHNFGNTLDAVRTYAEAMASQDAATETAYAEKKAALDAVAAKLGTLGVTQNRYTVLTVADIEQRRQGVAELSAARKQAYDAELQRQTQMEDKRIEFAQKAADFVDFINAKKHDVVEAGAGAGEPEERMQKVEGIIAEAAAGEAQLAGLDALDQEMKGMGISHNSHTDLNMNILRSRWGRFQAFSKNYVASLADELEDKHKLQARLAEFAEHERVEGLRIDFANAAAKVSRMNERVQEATFPIVAKSTADVIELQQTLADVAAERAALAPVMEQLGTLNNALAAAGSTQNPLTELTFEEATALYDEAAGAIAKREAELQAEAAKQEKNEQLRREFAGKANALDAEIDAQLRAIAGATGEPDAQLKALASVGQELHAKQAALAQLAEINSKLIEAQITENPHTKLTFPAVEAKLKVAERAIDEKRAVLNSAIEQKKGSQVSEGQLRELRDCFKHFDKDGDGRFNAMELKACFSSLGEDLNDEAIAKVFAKYAVDGMMGFDMYVQYMTERLADTSSQTEIQDSFQVVAGGRDYVSEAELRSNFPAETVEYLMRSMPPGPNPGTYDYTKFTASIFSR
jgi:Ca2+-binding EF-hand superfamily protein